MITNSEIKSLAAITGDGNLFVSLYLNVNPLTDPKGKYITYFKNMAKEQIKEKGKETGKKVKEDIKKIELYLKDVKRETKKGISIISCDPLGYWKNYHLSLPVKNELVIDSTTYIKPLLTLLNNYPRCVVLLVDKEAARIFMIHLGEIEEYTELFTPDIPGRHKKGGWFALQQNRFERHINYHVTLHIKDVLKALEEFLLKEDVERIILGGTEEAILKTKNLMSAATVNKVIATFPAKIMLGEKDVLGRTSEIIENFEKEHQNQIVEEIVTKSMKNDMAVTGIDNVMVNLQEGKVMKLVFLKDMRAAGFRCTDCGFLTSQSIKSCPYCGKKIEEIPYLIEFAAQKAVEQGVSVEIIAKNDKLTKAGGIGAFLRF
jgi:peptide chain release factor subunit 1